jgi:hypothetical protein
MASTLTLTATLPDMMEELLQHYGGLFSTPTGLPPARQRYHRIWLKPGMTAVAVHPYQYVHAQKAKIERQCANMLELGVVCPSASPFSALVLLIKKQDKSWRMCIDYHELNNKTIKDQFPIPVVEELLDELRGATFFTKLDMRSGYHQVLMHLDNVEKTVFRTHQGLFEFLVIPFGLCNAPATFQAIMNEILHPFILIYSSSWSEHLACPPCL